ncbi:MAG: hypothetical protein F6J93_06385 [Oscillatoria sp. SIO1A7]|nr:hypothetical protein [Oscillatoria sp. SIO1A7]
MEKLTRNLGKILALTFACLVCFFSSPAMADGLCIHEGPVSIQDGSFNVETVSDLPMDITIRSAIVTLPPGETGTIDTILITRPYNQDGCPETILDGESVCIEFGCSWIEVENGTDLIPACGGPAVLKAAETTYHANGSHFGPQGTFDGFSVDLCDEFAW